MNREREIVEQAFAEHAAEQAEKKRREPYERAITEHDRARRIMAADDEEIARLRASLAAAKSRRVIALREVARTREVMRAERRKFDRPVLIHTTEGAPRPDVEWTDRATGSHYIIRE